VQCWDSYLVRVVNVTIVTNIMLDKSVLLSPSSFAANYAMLK